MDNLRGALTGALGVVVAVGEAVGGIGGALGELAGDALRGPRPVRSPLAGLVSEQRRYTTVSSGWPTFARSGPSIRTRSTTWSWRWSPGDCGTGC